MCSRCRYPDRPSNPCLPVSLSSGSQRRVGERICVLKDGTIQQGDTLTTLYDRPVNAFVAGFIGSPEMNIRLATVVALDGGLGGHELAARVPTDFAGEIDTAERGQTIPLGFIMHKVHIFDADTGLNLTVAAMR